MYVQRGMVVKRTSGYMPGRACLTEPFEMEILDLALTQMSMSGEFCRVRITRPSDELSPKFLDLSFIDEEVPIVRVNYYVRDDADQLQLFLRISCLAGQVESYRRLMGEQWCEEIDWIFQEVYYRYASTKVAAAAGFCPLPRAYSLMG